ncbi:zf-RING_2 domain-containing protein/VWA_3 domain-containing protein [Cephalotus follicularis]|uniref:Zf-RING_2 domain-containing protein/VWA_3 domain-containing protein n=1 Tax=Cephalotus follicularis TaxID=3775 RepID=A0A1Q3B3T4_CEPFO|nr:zf-RING_2 domain-containing protein/VWA_3 domain-containing protein [Cephalotus follicularis]
MGSKWRKVKLALGLNMCMYVPHQSLDESSSCSATSTTARFSDAVSLSPQGNDLDAHDFRPTTPTPSSSALRLSKSVHKPSKMTCAICLTTMKSGQGHAIFMAECSHSFHFHCITSNVKHGNQICPVCRAKWKEIPFQNPASEVPPGRPRINLVNWPQDDAWMTVVRPLPPPRLDALHQIPPPFPVPEPAIFDDDEVLDDHEITEKRVSNKDATENNYIGTIKVRTYPEISAVSRAASHKDFTVLINLKAPLTSGRDNGSMNQADLPPTSQNSRAPVDLVTVLDVSGSMAGTKLALLKRAMGFVIQNLGPSDRLSVTAFSSKARRIFSLRRMTEAGRQEALQAVNSLTSNGGTNIAEGLRLGAKVLVDRKWKNPVASIILLSDGQDTYSVTSPVGGHSRTRYQSLLPISIHRNSGTGLQIPVHSFGFGTDHDAASMHSISQNSGGTFSFIEAEGVIQDAFAQCIGGLLSVVVQELRVTLDCVHSSLQLGSIKSGSYQASMIAGGRKGFIDVGDLYAEEERDFLVTVNIPVDGSSDEMSLLKVRCLYRNPITKEIVTLEEASEVKIQRPLVTGQLEVSMEVDRQRNRLRAAEAMAEARVTAERGDLTAAVSVLENCCWVLSESASSRAGDRLCAALCAELKEMQERMANRRVYEASGRAYVLSGLSSHTWQRATARGDSTESTSLVQAYQTQSMVDMVTRSQTMLEGKPLPPQRKLRQAQSFPARPLPR